MFHRSVAWLLTLHLDQKLCLDAARRLALVLVPGAAQRVHFVDEDDRRFVLTRQIEQVLHQPDGDGQKHSICSCCGSIRIHNAASMHNVLLALSQPLGHEVRGRHGEEGGVVGFGGHGLGQVGLPRPWRTEQKDASPRSPLA